MMQHGLMALGAGLAVHRKASHWNRIFNQLSRGPLMDLLIVLRDVTYSLALLGNFVRFAHSAPLVFHLRGFSIIRGERRTLPVTAKHAFGIHHSRSQDTFD